MSTEQTTIQILQGPPGAGKTTYIKEHFAKVANELKLLGESELDFDDFLREGGDERDRDKHNRRIDRLVKIYNQGIDCYVSDIEFRRRATMQDIIRQIREWCSDANIVILRFADEARQEGHKKFLETCKANISDRPEQEKRKQIAKIEDTPEDEYYTTYDGVQIKYFSTTLHL